VAAGSGVVVAAVAEGLVVGGASRLLFDGCREGARHQRDHVALRNVTQQANDVQQVTPLLDKLSENFEAADITDCPQDLVADAGDYSDANVRSRDMIPYIATQRLGHHEELPPNPRGRIPKSLTPKQRMARTLRTKQGRNIYKKRKGQVEPALFFGKPTQWSDQTSDRLPPILAARISENERRMATRLPDPQPPETLASRPHLIGPQRQPINGRIANKYSWEIATETSS
jgi:hypothetical protein